MRQKKVKNNSKRSAVVTLQTTEEAEDADDAVAQIGPHLAGRNSPGIPKSRRKREARKKNQDLAGQSLEKILLSKRNGEDRSESPFARGADMYQVLMESEVLNTELDSSIKMDSWPATDAGE
jgi:hypothetical protein